MKVPDRDLFKFGKFLVTKEENSEESSLSDMYHRLAMRDEEEDRKFPIYILSIWLFWVGVIVAGYYFMKWFINP